MWSVSIISTFSFMVLGMCSPSHGSILQQQQESACEGDCPQPPAVQLVQLMARKGLTQSPSSKKERVHRAGCRGSSCAGSELDTQFGAADATRPNLNLLTEAADATGKSVAGQLLSEMRSLLQQNQEMQKQNQEMLIQEMQKQNQEMQKQNQEMLIQEMQKQNQELQKQNQEMRKQNQEMQEELHSQVHLVEDLKKEVSQEQVKRSYEEEFAKQHSAAEQNGDLSEDPTSGATTPTRLKNSLKVAGRLNNSGLFQKVRIPSSQVLVSKAKRSTTIRPVTKPTAMRRPTRVKRQISSFMSTPQVAS